MNKLSLNVKKTKFRIFHLQQRNTVNPIPQLNLNEQIIERVTDFYFLGLTIDQNLTWNWHVQKNIKQDIKITRDYVQIKNTLRIFYNSLILPHLQHCVLSWDLKLY